MCWCIFFLLTDYAISTLSCKQVMSIKIIIKKGFCSQWIRDRMKKASHSCKDKKNDTKTFLFSFFQDFSVTRRLREDEGKDKTLEAILKRQSTWDKT